MNLVLDTNIIHGILNQEDSHHAKALQLLNETTKGDRIYIPHVVVFEALVVTDQTKKVLTFCEDIAYSLEGSSKKDFVFLETIDLETRKSLKANDCLILAMCHRLDAKLLTFDRKLKKVYEKLFGTLASQ